MEGVDFYYLSCVFKGWNLSFTLVSLLFVYLWLRSRRPSDLPPGPMPLPVFGNLSVILKGDILKMTRNLRKKYGKLCSLSIGPYWAVFVNDAKTLHSMFVKCADKFSDRPDVFFLKTVLDGKGFGGYNGLALKTLRKFSINSLKRFGFGKRSMESKILEETEYLVQVVEANKGKSVCLKNKIDEAVSNVICYIVIGKRFKYDDQTFLDLLKNLDDVLSNPYVPLVNWMPFLHSICKIYDVLGTKKTVEDVQKIRAYFVKIIEEHKSSLNENEPRDFIDEFLLEWENSDEETQFTEIELASVIVDLFGAGTDTTASGISWAILFLVNYPDVQERMRAEMNQIIGAGRQPLIADRYRLPYCQSVILETLRLGNIVPLSLPHTATEDVIFEGYRIPKGSIIIPNLNATMHEENLFPDSDTFDPSRYLDDFGNLNSVQDNIFPFSLGRRTCLGESLARMELFLFLTAIVRQYRILPPNEGHPPKIEGRIGTTHSPVPYLVRFVDVQEM